MRALAPLLVVALGLAACEQPAPPPAASVTRQASCGEASDETVRIMQGLAPSCEGCHLTGVRAYWSSVSSFQNLVVANPALITPGDPDASEFVRLLEGAGRGAFKQMPIGTKRYADLVAEGTASLPIDDVKAWVRGLTVQARNAQPDFSAPRVSRLKPEQVQRALYQQLGLAHGDFFTTAGEYGIVMAEQRTDELYPFQPNDALPAPRQQGPRDRFQALGGGSSYGQRRSDLSVSPGFVLTLTQVSQRWCRLGLNKQNNVALFPTGATRTTDAANVKATIRRWFLHFHGRRATDAAVEQLYTAVWQPLSTDPEAAWVGLCSSFIRHPDWIFY
jgi:hypothetical protein